jgi:hypothetical protein
LLRNVPPLRQPETLNGDAFTIKNHGVVLAQPLILLMVTLAVLFKPSTTPLEISF